MSLFLLPETPDNYSGDEVLKSIVDLVEDVLIEPVGSSFEAYLNIYNGLILWNVDDGNDIEEEEVKQNIKKRDLRKEMFVEDYYALLGIQDLSWRATQDDIKKAYKKMVIIHHPDKQGGDEKTFKMISAAYEKLSDPTSRLAYDSSQPFDDTLPSLSQVKSDFYGALSPIFTRNEKFSTKEMPEFGDGNTDITQVFAFYEAWYGFSSWRDFSHLDEYDPDEFDSREEKRWVERKNNKQRSKKLKEEKGRISKLVNMAYQNDPRIVRHKEEEKVRRIEAKKQRAIDTKLRKEENERKKAVLKKQKEEAEIERLKQIMEQQQMEAEERAKILEKKKSKLRSFCEHFEYDSERAEFIIENLEFDSFIDLFNSLKKKKKKEVFEILDEQFKLCSNGGTHSESNEIWTRDELTLLSKAVVQFPGGIPNRWDRIYEVLGGSKSKDAIIKKVKNASKVKQNKSNKLAQQYEQSKGGDNIVVINLEVENDVADWDPSEQTALEEALLKYPSALGKSRWESIAAEVPGRSKKECVERYKYLLDIIKKTRANKS